MVQLLPAFQDVLDSMRGSYLQLNSTASTSTLTGTHTISAPMTAAARISYRDTVVFSLHGENQSVALASCSTSAGSFPPGAKRSASQEHTKNPVSHTSQLYSWLLESPSVAVNRPLGSLAHSASPTANDNGLSRQAAVYDVCLFLICFCA
jgi:hypothetical protein